VQKASGGYNPDISPTNFKAGKKLAGYSEFGELLEHFSV